MTTSGTAGARLPSHVTLALAGNAAEATAARHRRMPPPHAAAMPEPLRCAPMTRAAAASRRRAPQQQCATTCGSSSAPLAAVHRRPLYPARAPRRRGGGEGGGGRRRSRTHDSSRAFFGRARPAGTTGARHGQGGGLGYPRASAEPTAGPRTATRSARSRVLFCLFLRPAILTRPREHVV